MLGAHKRNPDQLIADRIVSAGNFPLVDVIVDRLLGAPR